MNDPERRLPDAHTEAVLEKIDDYRRRVELLQTQARELAGLQAEVLTAAQREAVTIVDDARRTVGRILTTARRELQDLNDRIQKISEKGNELGIVASDLRLTFDSRAARESVLRARQEIARLLEEAKPEADSLRKVARAFGAVEAKPGIETVRERTRGFVAEESKPEAESPRTAARAFDTEIEVPEALRTHPQAIDASTAVANRADLPEAAPLFQREPFRQAPVKRSRVPPILWVAAFVLAGLSFAVIWWWLLPSTFSRRQADAPAASVVAPGKAASPTVPAAPSGALALIVEARRPVWVRTTVDGHTEQSRVLGANERVRVSGNGEISIRAGDAGAVFVSVNGGKPQPLGVAGAVVTRRFIAADQVRNGSPPASRDSNEPAPSNSVGATAAEEGAPARLAPSAPVGLPPSATRPGAAASAVPAATTPPSGAELTMAAQRWLDAYHRQDTAAMRSVSSTDMKISDQRGPGERLSPSAANVRRVLEEPSFQFVGETAILSAKMVEQGDLAASRGSAPYLFSWVSLMWIREGGAWRLVDVQILSDRKLRGKDPALD